VSERVIKKRWEARGPIGLPPRLVAALQWFVTFQVVCLAWVFFRAPSLSAAFSVLGRLFAGGGSSALVTPLLIVTVLAMLASQFVPPRVPDRATEVFARTAPLVQALAVAGGLVLVDALGPAGLAPFIYFRF
jgi:hypothetical protein